MIAPLRCRHRWMTTILAIGAPAVLILGVMARPEPVVGALPTGLTIDAEGPALATAELEPTTADGPEGTVAIHAAHVVVELTTPLRAPSVLAYWLPSDAADPGEGSHVLGPVSHGRSNTYALPAEAHSGGTLLLWSLGHATAIARVDLPTATEEATR